MHPLLGLHALATPAIEVNMCMSSGIPSEAGKGVTILKGCNTVVGEKTRVLDQVDISSRPLDKAMR